VFFPTQLINQYAGAGVAKISRILPPTYRLDGIRRVLIEGQGFAGVRTAIRAAGFSGDFASVFAVSVQPRRAASEAGR
jgi:hypothetical protein